MIYLDNSATTWPKPRGMAAAMLECMHRYGASPGRAGHSMSLKVSERVYACREAVAELFGTEDPAGVVFTANATEALNIAIKGMLKPGDHAVITSMEHNSVLRPIHALTTAGVRYSMARGNIYGYVEPERIESLIRANTRLIVATHVSNVCGTVNPIEQIGEIAQKHGICFLVDAAQSAGVIPIDMERLHIDMLAAAGHKGLYGPQGTGVLCIRPHVNPDCLKQGGTGSYSEQKEQPEERPDKYESGTLNAVGICGLLAGVTFLKRVGVEQIGAHEARMAGMLMEDLSVIRGVRIHGLPTLAGRTGVVSFTVDGMDCVEIANELDARYGIACRAGYHCAYTAHQTIGTDRTGTVRLSPGAFSVAAQMKSTARAIAELARR